MIKIWPGRCIVIFLSVACSEVCAQQQADVDSILTLLTKLPSDSNKVKAYDRLGYIYNNIQLKTELARRYIDSARRLSENLDYQPGVFAAHYNYGLIDINESNYDEALAHFYAYINYYKEAGDSTRVANGLYGIGSVYTQLGEYNKNLAIQLRVLKIYEAIGKKSSMAHTLNSIASVYWRTENFKKALETYDKANEIYKELGDSIRYGMGVQNVANVYVTKKSYDSGKLFYHRALKIIKSHGSDAHVSYILGNLAALYEELKDYDQALAYSLQTLKIRRAAQTQKRILAAELIGIGHLYILRGQYSLAENHLDEGMEIAESIKSKKLLEDGYLYYAKLFSAKNDYKKAYDFINQHHQWKDSIFNEESIRQINELQTRYETSEKDKQISLLAKENEIRTKEAERQSTIKKALIGGFSLSLIVAGLIIYTFRERVRNENLLATKNNEIKEINFKRQMSELEMKALRAQINPHFLFNCMNSINRMILLGETDNASRYLTKFSTLVRLVLENAEKPKISLEDELKLLESYIQLESLRFKGKIGYKISVDESIEKENTYLPSMVLQPFVENAIWHGLIHKEKDEKGIINIDIREEEDRLHCTIEDNGVGRERAQKLREKSVLKNKSMGMKITEERLKLLSHKALEQLIRITDLTDDLHHALGTRVEINIPIS